MMMDLTITKSELSFKFIANNISVNFWLYNTAAHVYDIIKED